MLNALRHVHQPSALNMVFIITLAMLLAGAVFMAMGVTELLGLQDQGVPRASPFLESLF